MRHRFFVSPPITSSHALLTDAEAHHLKHVMRGVVGDVITLFDGTGREYEGRVDRLGRSEVEVTITDLHAVDREAARQIVIGVTLPKGDRQRWLVEKLTELGVTRLVPLRSHRSVAHPDQRGLAKLRRFVVEASKQCGRNRLMAIDVLTDLSHYLTAAPADAVKWFADPAGQGFAAVTTNAPVFLAIGPEGGFTSEEREMAVAAGWQLASLGPRILRIETAAVVLTTLNSLDWA